MTKRFFSSELFFLEDDFLTSTPTGEDFFLPTTVPNKKSRCDDLSYGLDDSINQFLSGVFQDDLGCSSLPLEDTTLSIVEKELPQQEIEVPTIMPLSVEDLFVLDVEQLVTRLLQIEQDSSSNTLPPPEQWNFPYAFQSKELFTPPEPRSLYENKFKTFQTNMMTVFFSKTFPRNGPSSNAVTSFIENTLTHGLEVIASWDEIKILHVRDFLWYISVMTTLVGMDLIGILNFLTRFQHLHFHLEEEEEFFTNIVLYLERYNNLDLKFPADVAPMMAPAAKNKPDLITAWLAM